MNEQALFDRFGRVFAAGTVLFRQGELGKDMYVLQAGEIEISRWIRGRETVLAVLPAGEFFGEMAIINNRPRSATATVRREARVLVIDGRTFEAMLRGKVEIAVRMIKTLARRLEQADQQLELLLLADSNHRVVKCLRQLADQHTDGTGDYSGAVVIPIGATALAARVALPEEQVHEVIERLAAARLVLRSADAGLAGEGYLIPEVGRLSEFLEFLEMKERFGREL